MCFIRSIIKFLSRGGYDDSLKKLANAGAAIGEGVHLYSKDIFIDPTRPWLLSIGDYTKITKGVIILTHDYSLSVLRRVYGEWIGEGKETVIGENCFIGMNSVILMGSRIGDNCIIGAGSVVSGVIPSNTVCVGNPAKVIRTLDDHYTIRKKRTIEEAKECARVYHKRFGKYPLPKDLSGFKFLFAPRDKQYLNDWGLSFFCTGDVPSEVEESFFNSKPYWNSYDDFISEVQREDGNG